MRITPLKTIASLFAFSILAFASLARAQSPALPPLPPPTPEPASVPPATPPPPPIVYTPPASPDPTETSPAEDAARPVPPARTGFQMALRTGYMVPLGNASGAPGDSMGNTFSGQVPLLVDLGGKPDPHLFLGGYIGIGVGGTSGLTSDRCSAGNITCVTATFRLGLELQVHLAPAASVNPWLGYGIGLESTALSASGGGGSGSVGVTGWELAHLMAGVDFRVSRKVGIGPVLDFSLGKYTHETQTVNGTDSGGDLPNTAMHEWLMLGVRVVFFP